MFYCVITKSHLQSLEISRSAGVGIVMNQGLPLCLRGCDVSHGDRFVLETLDGGGYGCLQ